VRTNFLLLNIAEKEKLEVTEQDVAQRVLEMASATRSRSTSW